MTTHIPFPDPYDANALNAFLDALVDGQPVQASGDVQAIAQQFQAMAQVGASPPTAMPRSEGAPVMQTAVLSPPVSNRTRRQQSTPRPIQLSGWVSAAMIAVLLLSMFGSAWLNRGGGDPRDNLAWAPATPEQLPETPFAWTAPITSAECPADATRNAYDPGNPAGTAYTEADYELVSTERSYEIVGPPDPADAQAVVQRLRASYGCIDVGKSIPLMTARFEWENRTTAGRESLESQSDQRAAGAEGISVWLQTELGLTPVDMYVYQDPAELGIDGAFPTQTRGLFNPDHAVLFADGRIGIIPSIVSYTGFPAEITAETVPGFAPNITILVLQDGEWMVDETLPICLGECSELSGVSGGDSESAPWEATPIATPGD